MSDTLRTAISSATQGILQVVDQHFAAQSAGNTPASNGAAVEAHSCVDSSEIH